MVNVCYMQEFTAGQDFFTYSTNGASKNRTSVPILQMKEIEVGK